MKRLLSFAIMAVLMLTALAQTQKFCISKDGKTTKIVVADNDWKGVIIGHRTKRIERGRTENGRNAFIYKGLRCF